MKRVRVGDVLEFKRRAVSIDLAKRYTLIGVYSFGKGIFHRDPRLGADLGDYKFSEIEPGDLVVSNIQAWEGAIGCAGAHDAHTVGTHRFLTYVPVDENEIDTNWARYFFLGPAGFPLIQRAAPGSVTRNRTLSRRRFEDLEIPLPDIEEQRRIATHLDTVTATVTETFTRLRERDLVVRVLNDAVLSDVFNQMKEVQAIGDFAEVHRGVGPQYMQNTDTYCLNQGCVQWSGMTLNRTRSVDPVWAAQVADVKRAQEGDVLVNSTGEGTIGRACLPGAAVGLPFDSHVLAVRTDTSVVTPEFLTLFLRSPEGQASINRAKGANTTKQTELGKKKTEGLLVPTPPLEAQHAVIARLNRKLAKLGEIQSFAQQSYDLAAAVMPAALNRAFASMV